MHSQSVLKELFVSSSSLPTGLALVPSGAASHLGLLVQVASVKGAPVLGFAYRDAAPGDPFEVHIAGLVRGCKAGAPVQAGERVMCDERGRVVPFEAGTPYHCIGFAVTAAKHDDALINIMLR